MASGYDISSRHPFSLMAGRLGTYDKRPFDPTKIDPKLNGILDQSTKLKFNGGNK